MARAYSQDLRDRVIDAALSGVSSARGSAGHFGIGVATAIVWVRRARQTGDRKAHKQGAARPRKLEPHRDFLLALIDDTPDLTLDELLARLLDTHGVTVARSTLWTFLDRCGLTFKTYGPPRLQAILSRAPIDQSASTYPASEHAPSRDGDTRGPVLIKTAASSTIF
ncbi:transposase [Rhodoblastus sphagnicola]|uniref:transposase n=1 Tax=Rhodoblastus sphagnicola TaxID=333368 RepID=UPI001613883E|nr:transposase [Rhodoblastus sphagnicola]MBB4201158.1 transposase [Rhodoblastus sphagnicola]